MARLVKFTLVEGVILEPVGDDVFVMLPEGDLVSLAGEAATIIRRIHLGQLVDAHHPEVNQLVELGILHVPEGVTRRGLIRAGAIGAGAGIAVVSLPGVAVASSGCPVIGPLPDGTYGGAAIYFEVGVSGANTFSNTTNFRWEAAFLPAGEYYYTVSAPASGTVEAFTFEDSFVIAGAGEYPREDFSRTGVFEGFADGGTSREDYEALLTYSLFSDANRVCPVDFTTNYAEAEGS